MQPNEAEKIISTNVSVTRQKITIMKRLILSHGTLEAALKELDALRPTRIVIHQDIDPMPALQKASDWISYSLAGCEAIWELVHAGVLVQLSSNLTPFNGTLEWTTVYGSSGGMSAGWRFERFQSAHPSHFTRSLASDRDQVLADADLYLQRLSLPNLHQDIADALRDAVRCFRAELFVPSVVMLGKASEGAWIELGVALAGVAGPGDAKAKKSAELWAGPEIGFARKLRDILGFYESRQSTFKPLSQQIGIGLEDLRIAMLWSDTLRDARNAVHHRVSTSVDASYEIVATLLLAAVPHLQTIHRLWDVARTSVP
jgi:hypothetical protein